MEGKTSRLGYLVQLVFLSTIFICFVSCGVGKVKVDRYNYIQRPTDTSVTIAWRTMQSKKGEIVWGVSKDQLVYKLKDSTATQKHFFNLTDLTPNTKYFYQTTAFTNNSVAIDSFYTAKRRANPDFSFLHYGDCGTGELIQEVMAEAMEIEVNKSAVDFSLVAGDVDQNKGGNYDEIFFLKYKNMLKHSCHYTALGNHDSYRNKGKTYLDAFYLPSSNNLENTERYYSFSWGNAKFICLDSNYGLIGTHRGGGVKSKAQLLWLEHELKCNDKKWVFVYFHHPPYTVAWTGDYYVPLTPYFRYTGTKKVVKSWMPLFEKYQVDFVLTGHAHCYQRGIYNGVNYVISGSAGTELAHMDKVLTRRDADGNWIKRSRIDSLRTPDEMYHNNDSIVQFYDVKGVFPTVIYLFVKINLYGLMLQKMA
ncbi:MAG: metallophosphoesterase family protein [Flavobacteriales bacterium]|nr:metallophosphoesterase family protein [Flavobacteriales bacterium]